MSFLEIMKQFLSMRVKFSRKGYKQSKCFRSCGQDKRGAKVVRRDGGGYVYVFIKY